MVLFFQAFSSSVILSSSPSLRVLVKEVLLWICPRQNEAGMQLIVDCKKAPECRSSSPMASVDAAAAALRMPQTQQICKIKRWLLGFSP